MNRRAIVGTLAATALLGACGFTDEYALSWDEEVLLHDGTMIVVRVTRYFTRDFQLPTFQLQYYLRDMQIEFDAGPPWGKYRRRFTGYEEVAMVDRKDGNWYLIIHGDPGKHRITDPRYPIWIIGADGVERSAKSMSELPDFPRYNILPYCGPRNQFFGFKSSIVKWDRKIAFWRNHPRAPGDGPELKPRNPLAGGKP